MAHSAGGLIAKLYANEHPEDVSGLILIDVTTQYLKVTWTPKEMEVFSYSVKQGPRELISVYKDAEVIDFDESFKQLEEYRGKTLKMPAIVLSAGKIPNAEQLTKNGTWPNFVTQDMANSIIEGVHKADDLLAKDFVPTAKRINVEDSGHYIHKEQPELIIQLIRDIVMQQRKSGKTSE